MYQDSRRYGNVHPYDYANWGYIILYLVVILFSLCGNSLFLMTIKKNQHFRRTHHIFLAFLSMRDLIVTILVVPFVIDSQVMIHNCLINDQINETYFCRRLIY